MFHYFVSLDDLRFFDKLVYCFLPIKKYLPCLMARDQLDIEYYLNIILIYGQNGRKHDNQINRDIIHIIN